MITTKMLSMKSPFRELLAQLASGITIFEPFHRTPHGINEFQDTVQRLLEMEREGLVGRVFTEKRSSRGQDYYILASVRSGLTTAGERLLAEHQQNGSPE